ncbi:MAG: YbaN family protein [Sphingomonadales bacterium]|jgi:uncharacterized membrane protein YbaN (DUF454 family)
MKIFTRPVFFTLGLFFVAIGGLGVILPVLPTTPFMLLALWCFARSSKTFHDWLFHHRLFGPPLQRWESYRVIPLGAKIFALTSMTASAIYVLLVPRPPLYASLMMLAFMAYGAYFILSKPSRPPENAKPLAVEHED